MMERTLWRWAAATPWLLLALDDRDPCFAIGVVLIVAGLWGVWPCE